MNEKKFALGIVGIIIISAVISVIVGVSSYNNNKDCVLDANSNDYIDEEYALKAKEIYDTEQMKQEFIDTATSISSAISSKLLDGSVLNDKELKDAVYKYNKILSSSNWEELGVEKPKDWIGKWQLDENGFLKFKFSSENLQPDWITDSEVQDYILLD